jgi:hypothetical protein
MPLNLSARSQADSIVVAARQRAERLARSGPQIPHGKPQRKHGKRHSTNKERSHDDRVKAAKATRAQSEHIARRKLVSATMRAYFRGEIPDLSPIAHLIG